MPLGTSVTRLLAGAGVLLAAIAIGTAVTGAQNPSLVFATTDSPTIRSTADAHGNIYVAALASDGARVTKLTPSRTVAYTTVLTATRFFAIEPGDCQIDVADIAVDGGGNVYLTGCTSATDFPLVRAFRTTLAPRGSGFVTKLNAAGGIVYSTYFGSGGLDRGLAIAADDAGHAYVAGRGTNSRDLPLVNPVQTGGSGWAAKFDPAGSRLLYSTYIGAVPHAIAVDRSGAAYVAGSGNIDPHAVRPLQACRGDDAVVLKLNAAGSSYDYATCLGGSRGDTATAIAVDASGSAYVAGTTMSSDFPLAHPIDRTVHTGPLWRTDDGGGSWTNLDVDSSAVYSITRQTSGAGTWYAGGLDGGFRTSDGGAHWERMNMPLRDGRFQPSVGQIAAAPNAPSTVFASTSEAFLKSTDAGDHWTAVGGGLPFLGAFLRGIAIDPINPQTIYAASQQGFWTSTNGGVSWSSTGRGLGVGAYINTLAIDRMTGALFADVSFGTPRDASRIFRSTDRGETWTATPLRIDKRSAAAIATVREHHRTREPRNREPRTERVDGSGMTVYVAAAQVFSGGPFGLCVRSDDGGDTWTPIGTGLPPRGADRLAVAPADPRTVYASSRGDLFVSHDRGETFARVPGMSAFGSIETLAADPGLPGTLWVGAFARSDAFVVKIAPGGGAIEYATHLGGSADDAGARIIVDDLGRAIVIGVTQSDDLPDVGALQPRRAARDAFVVELDGGGSVLLFSTWLGGDGDDEIVSATRVGGSILISGSSTDLGGMFPGSVAGRAAFAGLLELAPGAAAIRSPLAPGR